MKIGILACGFECDENIDEVLSAWIIAKKNKLAGCEFVISVVYGQFKEYVDLNGIKESIFPTWIDKYKGYIDYFSMPPPLTEPENRNVALGSLLDQKCDLIWLLDLQDEIYTTNNIQKIIDFVNLDKFTSYFKISLKNYVFDKNTYLTEPFQPARIWRTKTNGYELERFYHDNDAIYSGVVVDGQQFKSKRVTDKDLPCKIIPATVAWITHFTWLDNEKSHSKINYQKSRGWTCSYRWDEVENCLKFNEEFYKKNNLVIPRVIEE